MSKLCKCTCIVSRRITVSSAHLVFQGHTWLDEISEGFIEVVRKDPNSDTDALTNMKYVRHALSQPVNEDTMTSVS
ncbi:hypothetical protein V1515DRAFT_602311 [Lipomyces mesembrius]